MPKPGKKRKYKPNSTPEFKKDLKRMKKRGKPPMKLWKVVELLLSGKPLPGNYDDHELEREWEGHRECHIEADWLLIYKMEDKRLFLTRTGTHRELFRLPKE